MKPTKQELAIFYTLTALIVAVVVWYVLKGKKTLEGFDDDLGPKYTQFKGKPKEAIKHLMKVKKGQAIAALYREEIGEIDIVWGKGEGKPDDYGLAHIIEKHAHEIAQLGFKVEDFVPIVVLMGNFKISNDGEKAFFYGKQFSIVVRLDYNSQKKNWVLTAFDMRPPKQKKPLGAVESSFANSFTLGTLPQETNGFLPNSTGFADRGDGLGQIYENLPEKFYACNDGTYSDHKSRGKLRPAFPELGEATAEPMVEPEIEWENTAKILASFPDELAKIQGTKPFTGRDFALNTEFLEGGDLIYRRNGEYYIGSPEKLIKIKDQPRAEKAFNDSIENEIAVFSETIAKEYHSAKLNQNNPSLLSKVESILGPLGPTKADRRANWQARSRGKKPTYPELEVVEIAPAQGGECMDYTPDPYQAVRPYRRYNDCWLKLVRGKPGISKTEANELTTVLREQGYKARTHTLPNRKVRVYTNNYALNGAITFK